MWKAPGGGQHQLSGRRILVVEDEPLIALELESLLADSGAEVVGPSRDLSEAMRLAGRMSLSAALLDVRIGAKTIAPLAQKLDDRKVPFAFYTGQTETDAVRRRWPSAPVIAKPAPAWQLVAVVAEMCARDGEHPEPRNDDAESRTVV